MSSAQSSIVILTDTNFDEVIQSSTITSSTITVIDFWASWCKPCLAFKPIFETVANDYPDLTFASVDIETQPQLANDFNIRSVPFIVVLKEQVVIYAEAGTLTQSAFVDLIEQAKTADMKVVHEAIKKNNKKKNN